MNIIHQFENGFHAVLVDAENGVTHFLAKVGDKATLHSYLKSGEVVAADLNLPFLRQILQTVDSLIPAQ